jgi:hypothetical protein
MVEQNVERVFFEMEVVEGVGQPFPVEAAGGRHRLDQIAVSEQPGWEQSVAGLNLQKKNLVDGVPHPLVVIRL